MTSHSMQFLDHKPTRSPFADAQRPQPARRLVGRIAQLGPGQALALVAGSHGQVIRVAVSGAMQQIPNRQVEKRAVGTARVAYGKFFGIRHVSLTRKG